MKKYLLLHYGFEQPTPDIMNAWEKWFNAIRDINVEQGGFGAGREISKSGAKDLRLGMDSITGYNIIRADSLEHAEKVARNCPYITGIRVYEIR